MEAPELIGAKPLGYCHWCPLCGKALIWSSYHGQLACTGCGWLFDLDDILTSEMEIE